ncbi:hypothetical protein QO062_02340 [Fervidobacterium pennivorans subsp. carthaginiensis]|uniref:hypothetical protein n=1 Tax=Fervidobacterium pennivorans TaxID=93466 RepID=UPI00355C0EBB
MEKLNLSPGKKRVLKLTTFLVLLFISILPSISLLSLSHFMMERKISKLLIRYPEVFNNLTITDWRNIDAQIDNLLSSLKAKESQLRGANEEIKNYIIEAYKNTYFLRSFLKYTSSSTNNYFLTSVIYDGQRFYIDFYEYGTETQISTSIVYNDLARFYKDVLISLLEQRNFLGDIKYFHYIWEGRIR